MTTTSERLAAWMKVENITAGQLAARMGMEYSYVWRVTVGERPISDGFRWKFSQAFGHKIATKILDNPKEKETT